MCSPIDALPMRQVTATLVVVAGLLTTRAVRAEPDAREPADEATVAADRLFEDGRKLAKDNHPVEACKRFAQSDAIKHTFGTALNLGDCARRDGHLGRAWRLYHDAVRAADRDGAGSLAQFARDRAAAIAPELCTVVVMISAPDVTGLTVRIADYDVAASSQLGRWAALVEPGQIDVAIDGVAGGARVTRKVACAAGGEVATVELHSGDLTGAAPRPPATPAAASQSRAAGVSVGVGYMPEQDVGASVAFGGTVELWARPRVAIDCHVAGAGFRTKPFMQQGRAVQQTGTLAFLGPSFRYAVAPQLWLGAGIGVAAGFWVGGGTTDGAVRPGGELGASYWFARSFNVSIDGFGFLDRGAHPGSISVMMGAKLH